MKAWSRLQKSLLIGLLFVMAIANFGIWNLQNDNNTKHSLVEIHRMKNELDQGASPTTFSNGDILCNIVKQEDLAISSYGNQSDRNVVLLPAEKPGIFYRFSYPLQTNGSTVYLLINTIFLLILAASIFLFHYIKKQILQPFHSMEAMAEALSHRDFSYELPQAKQKYFGKFIWAMDVMKEELKYYQQKDLERLKEKQIMIASLSHDIKTPLSNIRLYNEASMQNLYSKEIITQRIEENCDKIDAFIKDIMETNREDLFDFSITCREVYMKEIFSMLSKEQERIQMAMVTYEQAPYANTLILCDPFRLKEVLHNIVDNALKYGDRKWIHVSFYEEDHHQIIKITNSGTNIDVQDANAIFQSFYRGNNVEHQEGFGLGLYICKTLMKEIDGDIFMTQKQGEVSFHIVLGSA